MKSFSSLQWFSMALIGLGVFVWASSPDLVWMPSKLGGQSLGFQSSNPVLVKSTSIFSPGGLTGQSVYLTPIGDADVQGLALKGYRCNGFAGRSGDYLELRNYCYVSDQNVLGVRAAGLGVRLEEEIAKRVDWSGVRLTTTTSGGQTSWSTNLQSVSGVSWDSSYHDDVMGLAARHGIDNTYVEAVIYDASGDARSSQIQLFLPLKDWKTPTAENEDSVYPRFWGRINVKSMTDVEYIQFSSTYKAAINNVINEGAEVLKGVTGYSTFKEQWAYYSAVGKDAIKKIRVYFTSKIYCLFGRAICTQSISTVDDVSGLSESLLNPPSNGIPEAQTFILDTVHLFPPDLQIYKNDWIIFDAGGASGWDTLLKLSLVGYEADLGFEEWRAENYCPRDDKFYPDAELYKCATTPTSTTVSGGVTTTTVASSVTTTTLKGQDERTAIMIPAGLMIILGGIGAYLMSSTKWKRRT